MPRRDPGFAEALGNMPRRDPGFAEALGNMPLRVPEFVEALGKNLNRNVVEPRYGQFFEGSPKR